MKDSKIEIQWNSGSIPNQGYLSVKKEDDHENLISLGCSDGTVKLANIQNGKLEVTQSFSQTSQDEGAVCLMHDTNQSLIGSVMSNGSLSIFDKNTAKEVLLYPQLHSYETWFCQFSKINENIIWTCADDQQFKMVDIRVPEDEIS